MNTAGIHNFKSVSSLCCLIVAKPDKDCELTFYVRFIVFLVTYIKISPISWNPEKNWVRETYFWKEILSFPIGYNLFWDGLHLDLSLVKCKNEVTIKFYVLNDPYSLCHMALKQHFHMATSCNLTLTLASA